MGNLNLKHSNDQLDANNQNDFKVDNVDIKRIGQ